MLHWCQKSGPLNVSKSIYTKLTTQSLKKKDVATQKVSIIFHYKINLAGFIQYPSLFLNNLYL